MREMNQNPQTAETQATEVPFEVPAGHRLLSETERQALAAHLIEDHREQWQIEQMIDSAAVTGEINDMMRTELYYEFKQGGKWLRGLTAKMIGHLATERGISEVIEAREHVEDDDKHEFTVVVEMVNPLYPDRMIRRSGFAEEPKVVGKKYDKFAKQKAYTKAFRRACEKLIPRDLIIATTYKLARIVPVDWTMQQAIPQKQQAALPAPNGNHEDDETGKAQKAAFAAYNDKAAELEEMGITKEIFWEGVKAFYKVKSRAEMTAMQYRDLRGAINTKDFAKWICDLAPKSTETETSTEEGESSSTEDDMPF